jgi:VWFA-related protein
VSAFRAAVALLVALGAGQQDAPRRTPAVFGVTVDTVKLDVAVERNGKSVADLRADDFDVRDDGVAQQVELVSAEERVLHAVLVLDTSTSVAGERLARLKAAACLFVEGLGPGDAASAIAFSSRVRALPVDPYDHAGLRRAIVSLESGGSTALNDAVFAGLLRADPALGRPVVVVFSDGADRVSWLGPVRLRKAARALDAAVYGVLTPPGRAPAALGSPATSGGHSKKRNPRSRASRVGVLEDLASETGGRLFEATEAHLAEAFQSILSTVQARYVLSYQPMGVKGAGWHAVVVRLKRGQGQISVRRGYLRSRPD